MSIFRALIRCINFFNAKKFTFSFLCTFIVFLSQAFFGLSSVHLQGDIFDKKNIFVIIIIRILFYYSTVNFEQKLYGF